MEPYEQKTPGDRGNGIMRTEAGAPSPIWLEQAAAEELAGVCMEILGNARNELYLSMHFLDVALSSLYFAPDPAVRGLGTDGTTLFFQMESLAAMYKKNRILVNRTYLHGVLHCLFWSCIYFRPLQKGASGGKPLLSPCIIPLSVLPSVEPEKAGQGVLGSGL